MNLVKQQYGGRKLVDIYGIETIPEKIFDAMHELFGKQDSKCRVCSEPFTFNRDITFLRCQTHTEHNMLICKLCFFIKVQKQTHCFTGKYENDPLLAALKHCGIGMERIDDTNGMYRLTEETKEKIKEGKFGEASDNGTYNLRFG